MRAGTINYQEAKAKLIELWRITGNANKFQKKIFEDIPIKHDAHVVINELSNKYRICLISGSIDLFVKGIANSLNVESWYANTKLEFDVNDKLKDFDYTLKKSEKKLDQFREFQSKFNLSPDECAIVGDGESDELLFEELGVAILLESNQKTEKLIKLADYHIFNLRDLLQIFS